MHATYTREPRPAVPREQIGSVAYGVFAHLGAPIAYVAVLAVAGVTPWRAIWVFLAVSAFFLPFTIVAERASPAVALPRPTIGEVVDGLFMVLVKGLGVGGGLIAAGWWALSLVPLHAQLYGGWARIVAATLATDLAYYWIHRAVSHGRGRGKILGFYRRSHAAHHSVTALDFLRGNQSSLVDTAVSQFQPAVIVVSWLLGMDLGSTLAAYALILMLQATDHTNVTFDIGWLRYVFMDNHAHKLHHCRRGNLVNHGAAFSIWDRAFGTYYEDWSLSSGYLHRHGIPLPIRPAARPGVQR